MSINNFSKVDGFSGAQQVETVEGAVPATFLLALSREFYKDRDKDRELVLNLMGQISSAVGMLVQAIKADNDERIERREAAERQARRDRHDERMRNERNERNARRP